MAAKRQVIVDARGPREELPAREPIPDLLVDRPHDPETDLPPVPAASISSSTTSRLRGARPPRRLSAVLGLLAAGLIAVPILVGHHGHHGTRVTPAAPVGHTPPAAARPAARARSAVGMPIPAGNAPVQSIRIVLDVTGHRIPSRERKALARWIIETQNARTRLRIEDGPLLSAPITGMVWGETGRGPLAQGSGLRWLLAGARDGRDGALIEVGRSGSSRLIAPRVRESAVPASGSTLRIYRRVAADIARQIMVSSQQGYGGTTRP